MLAIYQNTQTTYIILFFYINRCVRIIKYWGKSIQSDNVLIEFLYNDMFIACNNGVNNWSYNVNQLLDNYGFSHVFRGPN